MNSLICNNDNKDKIDCDMGLDFVEPVIVPVTLISSDEMCKITLEPSVLNISKYVKTICDVDNTVTEIKLDKVDGETLEHIVEFMKHFEIEKFTEFPSPIYSNDFAYECKIQWYIDYTNTFSVQKLLEIMCGANYMEITPLINLIGLKIATLVKDKSQKDLEALFKF